MRILYKFLIAGLVSSAASTSSNVRGGGGRSKIDCPELAVPGSWINEYVHQILDMNPTTRQHNQLCGQIISINSRYSRGKPTKEALDDLGAFVDSLWVALKNRDYEALKSQTSSDNHH